MSKSDNGYKCPICGQLVPIEEKVLHESICKISSNNNQISSKNKNANYSKTFEELNNISNTKVFVYNFNIDMNRNNNTKEKIDSVNNEINNKTNNIINNTKTIISNQNEDLLNNDIIIQARNIESNYNIQGIINDNDNEALNLYTQHNIDDIILPYTISINNHKNPVDKTIIDKLNINEIKNKSKMTTIECSICRDEYKIGDKIVFLPCLHKFHYQCIIKWMNDQNKCPICNFVLTKNNINLSKSE